VFNGQVAASRRTCPVSRDGTVMSQKCHKS
jgi:hypothetical protein